jgi:CBS domain-containing protein
MRVGDVMTRDVTVVSPHASVREAARVMDRLNVGALPVCDGQRLVGIITDRDITVRCTAAGGSPHTTHVRDIMSGPVRWCFADDPVEDAEQAMGEVQIRRMPVVDGNRQLVGIVALGDLATEEAPGTAETLRRISEPSAPDRSGTLSETEAGMRAGGPARARGAPPAGAWREDPERSGFAGYRGEPGYGRGSGAPSPFLRVEPGRGPRPAVRGRDGGFGRPLQRDPASRGYRAGWREPREGRAIFDRGSEGAGLERAEDFRGIGPRGYRRSDERVREDVAEQFLDDPELDATEVEVVVERGEVTLRGSVPSRAQRRRADELAESVPGVGLVRNDLRVRAA